jgi:hypothetical protein
MATKPTNQVYPPPQDIASNNPYPGPDVATPGVMPTTDCSKVGIWIEYVNKESGFSFQYPAESKVSESVDNNGHTHIVLALQPECYGTKCWGSNTMSIGVLDNKTKLSLEDFVAKQYHLDGSKEYPSSSPAQELAKSAETISVDQIRALRVIGVITRAMPQVYIPYDDDHVIFVGMGETNFMPPFDPPCSATSDLYNKILASVKLLKH